jgi:GDPmannose 4,6-dehydratase
LLTSAARFVWRGSGKDEQSIDAANGRVLVEIDKRYFRPTEVDSLLGDPSKAKAKLGWRHKTTFDALVREMVETDLIAVRDEEKRRQRAE